MKIVREHSPAKISLFLGVFVLLLSLGTHANSPNSEAIEVIDATGNRVSLPSPARRVISLSPHVTELLYAAGATNEVSAVVSYSDYPPEAKLRPQVGSYNAVDFERIVTLKPDLLVAWGSGNGSATVEHLKRLGIPVYISEPRSFADVALDIEQLGHLTGHTENALKVAKLFRKRLSRLRARYAKQTPISVFYQIWDKPLITVNGQHLISKAITLCGGHNVFADLPVLAPKVGIESVLQSNPEVILSGGLGRTDGEWTSFWKPWQSLQAVKQNNLITINADWVQRQRPRIIDGAEQICRLLERTRQKNSPSATGSRLPDTP